MNPGSCPSVWWSNPGLVDSCLGIDSWGPASRFLLVQNWNLWCFSPFIYWHWTWDRLFFFTQTEPPQKYHQRDLPKDCRAFGHFPTCWRQIARFTPDIYPSRKRSHIPPWEKEIIFKHTLGGYLLVCRREFHHPFFSPRTPPDSQFQAKTRPQNPFRSIFTFLSRLSFWAGEDNTLKGRFRKNKGSCRDWLVQIDHLGRLATGIIFILLRIGSEPARFWDFCPDKNPPSSHRMKPAEREGVVEGPKYIPENYRLEPKKSPNWNGTFSSIDLHFWLPKC